MEWLRPARGLEREAWIKGEMCGTAWMSSLVCLALGFVLFSYIYLLSAWLQRWVFFFGLEISLTLSLLEVLGDASLRLAHTVRQTCVERSCISVFLTVGNGGV
jgi:hypothetical protein